MSGDYFHVMGVPLIKGRVFDATDTATSRQVVLVSQSAARQFWPGSELIGSKVRFRLTGKNYDAEVVGISATCVMRRWIGQLLPKCSCRTRSRDSTR